MVYAVELGSGAIVYKDCFRHLDVNKVDSKTHRQHDDCINILLFFQGKERRLETTEFVTSLTG
jgi:hypothetical protein